MTLLRFHQTTFDILELEPKFDPNARNLIKICEENLGVSLPPSVREWYSLSNTRQILSNFSNDDYPLSLDDLIQLHTNWKSYSYRQLNLAKLRFLPFLIENQGIFICTVQLDSSDDPPVLSIDDDDEWKVWEDHFSSFISHWVWNFLYHQLYSETTLRADDCSLKNSDLEYLEDNFTRELPSSDISDIYHFHRADQHIHIWRRDAKTSYWWLRAETKKSLLSLTQLVWEVGTLSKTLKPQGGYIHNPAGKVLEIMRFGRELPEKKNVA
jgi:hypothetical protein